MKAAVFYECGGPDKIQVVDLPQPPVKPDEVLIQIKAAALNHHDLWMLRGPADSSYSFPYCGGSDLSGVIAEVGRDVNWLKAGERVLVNPNLGCGKCIRCLAGEENYCPEYDILSGGFAEYIAVSAKKVLVIPDDLPYVQAAAVPLVFQTAWHALITEAQIRPGEDVLILGASGGVSSAAIQIAKLAGARVITTTSSEEKMEQARQLGADHVLNRNEGDYWSEIYEWTNQRGVDVVVENVGAATWAQSMRSLVKGGRLVSYSRTTGKIGETNISLLFWNQLKILGSTMSSNQEFVDVMQLVFQHKLKPVVDSVYPLEEARAAFAHLDAGGQFGKVIIQISEH
jgi:NADPH:quinone reductase-like Zn-dependent oxidoreductase